MNRTSVLFKFKDCLGGSKIRRNYTEIKDHFESKTGSSSSTLDSLLLHSHINVSFYKNIDFKSLNNFPIVNKSIIKSNFKEFRATNFEDKELIKMSTSGSTGTPFSVYQDKKKKVRNYGDTLYFGNLGGYHLGHRLIYLKIWVKEKMQAPWVYKLQQISTIDVQGLNDKEIQNLINGFKKHSHKVHTVLGYVSALEHIVRYCEKNNIDNLQCKFSGVITMSEGLSRESRLKIKNLFKCPVVSRYSNIENGIMAQQEKDTDYFLVNTASYIIEIFHPEKDELLADGLLGRIVLTDLYNYAMPFIRYDTGDMGVKEIRNGKTYLKSVEGRKLDLLFDTSGEAITSYIVGRNMWNYLEIEQYQLIQVGEKSYEFKINCPTGFKREAQLVNEFKSYLGEDADFEVIYVEGIPLLNSGKHRKTVNLYRNSI
ncbi:phenylacetate--CoA ligase family protein [Gelidibacter salicanalis]|uniref:Phenylacetate--CoA ligase family protein n=1 Tax=Gelidibacter salicanalis TaxID=291193 RepID=A0A934NK81_9FLAO|nr:phenylacetate--CoA ligase family protein [Gelidibacter salicanalis]MBJ7882884.1 phenylacetate--CoA ligase family protein [Gelidibacter salicanalis]